MKPNTILGKGRIRRDIIDRVIMFWLLLQSRGVDFMDRPLYYHWWYLTT